MVKIAHIADIHYRGLNRHDEYREVFTAFAADAKAQGVEHIFVGGDIFHTKTTGLSPEYIEEMTWWLDTLASVAEVHLTLGNHDGNLTNLSRQDAISPIVNVLRNPKIHLYKQSGVYQFAPGFNWCIFSLFDTEGWGKVKPEPGSVNIACYHGPVWGAVTETDWEIKEGLKVDDFTSYDFAMLGDIHKRQWLDMRIVDTVVNGSIVKVEKPWIAYPGSTLQQNYAEEQEHGYLLWNIKSRNQFDVEFRTLPNPRPFITIDWMGSVSDTLEVASDYPDKSRFRIKHKEHIPHKDTVYLTQQLKQQLFVSEVIFKSEHQSVHDYLHSGDTVLMKEDLRNPQVLLGLVKEYHKDMIVTDDEWASALESIQGYLSSINDEVSARNIQWSLKHLKFDNLFCYGEGNVINFQNLNGIVGIFGPNRSGKSSIPGTLMYSLFNSTDRGSIKNLHVCNARKLFCYSRVILTINGIDYAIERQTTKNENKRGDVHASTALNFFRVDDGAELADLAGEQRTDTEKTIRKYLGTAEDIAMTTLSAQGEINQVIELGSSKRNQLLSRFMDLDIFYKMWQLASSDVNSAKILLRQLPENDWQKLAQEKAKIIKEHDARIVQLTHLLTDSHERLSVLRNESYKHRDVVPVTHFQVEQQQERVATLSSQVTETTSIIDANMVAVDKNLIKLTTIGRLRQEYDLADLRKRQEALRKLESSVVSLRHNQSKEAATLKQQKRALKILNAVPCGDKYPTCSYIKDANEHKENIPAQSEKVKEASDLLTIAESSLEELKLENITDKIKKLEDLNQLNSQLTTSVSELRVKNAELGSQLAASSKSLETAKSRLTELKTAFDNDENVEAVAIRNEIDALQTSISRYDQEKINLATNRGKEAQAVETLAIDRKRRQQALQKMKIHELISYAFSKKGIPSSILADRLPVINTEISKILSGIVDFTVELERDEESDQLEIFLNYGDSRRLVELGSGMEKSISSIALRVALNNISSLPKSDFFIIDEGFGVFDDAGIEACNRLLTSLKRYFRIVLVITHIDGIKDIADHVLEITKNEKDSKVVFQ